MVGSVLRVATQGRVGQHRFEPDNEGQAQGQKIAAIVDASVNFYFTAKGLVSLAEEANNLPFRSWEAIQGRKTSTPPEIVLSRGGFIRKGTRLPGESDWEFMDRHVDLKRLPPGQPDHGIVGTSTNLKYLMEGPNEYVYFFRRMPGLSGVGHGCEYECEVGIEGKVGTENIQGWLRKSSDGRVVETWRNPNYVP
jgi:hypothetical protein